MKKYLSMLVLSIWMLPQNILGILCFMGFWLADKIKGKSSRFISEDGVFVLQSKSQRGGITLGMFIVLRYYQQSQFFQWNRDFSHEYGHYIQSILLGPFYLLVIGLPSLVMSTYCSIRERRNPEISMDYLYYNFYTEKWADYLGGVKREF